jgi:hypothetical protein
MSHAERPPERHRWMINRLYLSAVALAVAGRRGAGVRVARDITDARRGGPAPPDQRASNKRVARR